MPLSGKNSIRYNDFTPERSTVNIESAELTAANFDAQYTAFQSLLTAISNITEGLRVGFDFGNKEETVDGKTPAAAETAQRERKWLVYFTPAGGKERRMEIPCADLTGHLDPNNREQAHIGDGGNVDAFVTAFEAFVLYNGASVTVNKIVHVGRNV